MKNLSSFLPILFFLLFLPLFIKASNPLDVVINEIAWMGTKVEDVESKNWWRYEWLEFYNNTQTSVLLDRWKIELYRTDLDWSLEVKGVITAQSYFLIVASDKIFSNYDFNYSNLGGKLNNNGQKVILKDNLGNIIDEIDCYSSKKWFAGDNETKQTMERKSEARPGSDPQNWQNSQNPGGTPKAKNSVVGVTPQSEPELQPELQLKPEIEEPKPIIYPSGIVMNEILPNAAVGVRDEEGEYIEIFNQNNFEVNLSDWKIEDITGKITTFILPQGTKISPKGFLVFFRPATKITLNNDGDGLNLVQPDGKIIDSVNYEKAPSGQSYNRISSEWVWSAILTPGKANVISPQETEETEILEEPGKIDINTAPLKDLVKIIHIGEARAEELISLRPFYSLDDLTKIKGISDKMLEDIKKQGLAWVDPKLEPPKPEKTEPLEKGLAAEGEPMKSFAQSKKLPNFLSIFLIALSIAIFSGIIILIIKKKIKTKDV